MGRITDFAGFGYYSFLPTKFIHLLLIMDKWIKSMCCYFTRITYIVSLFLNIGTHIKMGIPFFASFNRIPRI